MSHQARASGGVRMATIAALAAVMVATSAAAHADVVDDAWKRGNEAYLRGDYATAVAAYEQLDRQGVVAVDLVYNLGTAYYRQGQVGRAIWAWERTLAIDPDAEDARYNLDRARKAVARRVQDKIEGADRDPLWIRAVTELALSTETWLFASLYLAFFLALALRVRSRRAAQAGAGEASPLWGTLAAIFGVTAAVAAALLVGRVALARTPFAIVLPDQLAVKEGADLNYRTAFEVHAGLRVRALDHDQGWVRVRLANGLEGWVPERDIGAL